jgi:hypothetical protein
MASWARASPGFSGNLRFYARQYAAATETRLISSTDFPIP